MRDARNAIHTALVAVLLWLSVIVQLHGTMLSPAFSGFAHYGNAPAWSYALLAAAMAGLVGLLSDRRWVRLASILLLACAHLSVAWCFFLGSEPEYVISPGAGTYGIIAALGYYLLLRRIFAP